MFTLLLVACRPDIGIAPLCGGGPLDSADQPPDGPTPEEVVDAWSGARIEPRDPDWPAFDVFLDERVQGVLEDKPSPCPNVYRLEGPFTLDVVGDPSVDFDATLSLYDLAGPWGSLDADFGANPDSAFLAWVDARAREVRTPLPPLRQVWVTIRPATDAIEITGVFDPVPPGPSNPGLDRTEVRAWEQPRFETTFTLNSGGAAGP